MHSGHSAHTGVREKKTYLGQCPENNCYIFRLESNAVLDRDLYNGRKIMFERMKEYFEEDGAQPDEIQADRERAAVIVDENAVQGKMLSSRTFPRK